ncbi:MAG: YbbR-like domain-containing protein [Bacteroidetes bacterium]|nr:MAG: YbbR-like domain-containing protein [Bacteroidota bacterium]
MPSLNQRIRARLPFATYSPEDRKIIAVCFAIAFFFWLLVKLSKDYVLHEVLELHYELPMGRAFSTEPPRQVSIELGGTGWSLLGARLPARHLKLELSVGEAPVFSLSPFELETRLAELLGNRITIRQLNFATVRIPLELRAQKTLPVVLQHQLRFAAGYSLMRPIEIEPDSVTVEGPASKLAELQYIRTDSLRLEPLKQSVDRTIGLQNTTPGLRVFPAQVRVRISVEQITEKTLYVPVQIVNAPTADSIHIFPSKVLVKCIVGLSRYSELSPEDFVLVADLEQTYRKDGRNSVPLELRGQPHYVRNVSYTPQAAEFFLVEESEE